MVSLTSKLSLLVKPEQFTSTRILERQRINNVNGVSQEPVQCTESTRFQYHHCSFHYRDPRITEFRLPCLRPVGLSLKLWRYYLWHTRSHIATTDMRLLYSHIGLQRARQHLIFLYFHKTETEKLQDQQLLENRAWVSSFFHFDVTDRLIDLFQGCWMFCLLCCCDTGHSVDIVITLTTVSSLTELVSFSSHLFGRVKHFASQCPIENNLN